MGKTSNELIFCVENMKRSPSLLPFSFLVAPDEHAIFILDDYCQEFVIYQGEYLTVM